MDHRPPVSAGADVEDVAAGVYEPDPRRAAVCSDVLQLRVEIELATPVMTLTGTDRVGYLDWAVIGSREVGTLNPVGNRLHYFTKPV